eukprot:2037800-Rhodomonas_salina.1
MPGVLTHTFTTTTTGTTTTTTTTATTTRLGDLRRNSLVYPGTRCLGASSGTNIATGGKLCETSRNWDKIHSANLQKGTEMTELRSPSSTNVGGYLRTTTGTSKSSYGSKAVSSAATRPESAFLSAVLLVLVV